MQTEALLAGLIAPFLTRSPIYGEGPSTVNSAGACGALPKKGNLMTGQSSDKVALGQRFGIPLSLVVTILVTVFIAGSSYGVVWANSNQLALMREELSEAKTRLALTEQFTEQLDRRGTERTAQRDAQLAELKVQTATLTTALSSLTLSVDRMQSELTAIRNGLAIPAPAYLPSRRPDDRG